jgi:bla regulator protein BlaR1
LLESWSQPPGLAALAGVLETADDTKRRIALVAHYHRGPFRWSLLSAAPLVVIALALLTNMTAPPAWGSAAPLADLVGRRIDRIDYPFVGDPAVLGGWRAVDFVRRPDLFHPGARQFRGNLFLKELHFLDGGRTSMAFRWTKGFLLHDGNHTASHYEIRALDGADYLFMEWKSGDYVLRGARPNYYVFKMSS